MKKIILSAASLAVAAVASVSVAPTTSEAIPAFARQTGSACLACHFQSFPTLNAYGRSFKMGGLTDVGDQALVEDEGLSIPAVVNWTVMVRPNFILSSKETTATGSTTTKGYELADQVFMIGGRAGEHTGVFLEVDTQGGGVGNMQMFNSFDMGDMKAGATIWSDGFGEDSGLQLMSVWGQHGGMLGGKTLTANHQMTVVNNNTVFGANGYATNGDAAAASGVTGWVATDAWAAQLALVDVAGNGAATDLKYSPVIRGNYFLEAGDWEIGLGAIFVTGSPVTGTDTKRTGIDVQAMGEVNDMQIGVFADYATAPSSSTTTTNLYNPGQNDTRTGYSFRATVKPTHNIIVLAGLGQDKISSTYKVDRTRFGVEWEAYQNFAVQIVYDTVDDSTTKVATTLLDFELLI